MYGINRACVVNPVNMIATIMLATPRQSIEIEELISQAKLHRRLIKRTLPWIDPRRGQGQQKRIKLSPKKSFTCANTNSATSFTSNPRIRF